MAAMHWEARRKQVVLDRKFDFQHRLKEQQAVRGNFRFLVEQIKQK